MTNHVHLLLTAENRNSAALTMKHLGQRYVKYINRNYRRSGTLWEGRFESCQAKDETYVLTCFRYIELNPARADMVSHPRDYRESSFRSNGDVGAESLLTPHDEYLRLGKIDCERWGAYRGLFGANLDSEVLKAIRAATNVNYVPGDARFQQETEAMLQRRVSPGRRGRPRKHHMGDEAG